MNLTDASVKRLVKRVIARVESQEGSTSVSSETAYYSGYGLGSIKALDEYREWLHNESLHNGFISRGDWRSSDIILLLTNRLKNTEFVRKNFQKHAVIVHCLGSDLLREILYDWQQKTIAIDKMHKAKKDLAELVSSEQE